MPSLFYKAAFERRFPLSFLLFEELSLRVEENGGEDIGAEMLTEVISGVLDKCLDIGNASDEDITYVSSRLEEAAEDLKLDDGVDENAKKKKSFASSFSDWAGSLEPHEICLLVADYDYTKATHLYTHVDRSDVVEMSSQWMKKEWERIKVEYESVVYGFGGSYGDQPHSEIDVSSDDHMQGKTISRSALEQVNF